MNNLRKTTVFCLLGPSGGSSWSPLETSWGALRAIFGRHGAILGPLRAILAVLEACWAILAAWMALLGRFGIRDGVAVAASYAVQLDAVKRRPRPPCESSPAAALDVQVERRQSALTLKAARGATLLKKASDVTSVPRRIDFGISQQEACDDDGEESDGGQVNRKYPMALATTMRMMLSMTRTRPTTMMMAWEALDSLRLSWGVKARLWAFLCFF